MKTALQIVFGLFLGLVAAVVCFYLGLVVRHGAPDFGTALVLAAILASSQWASHLAFRRRVAGQAFAGVALFVGVTAWLMYSSVPFFWESRHPDGSYSLTWRSGVVSACPFITTQALAALLFRRLRRGVP